MTFLGGLAVGTTACATPRRSAGTEIPLDDDELEAKLARLDRSMARIHSRTGRDWFVGQRDEHDVHDPEAREAMVEDAAIIRTSLRSALLVSSIGELPEPNRSDPRVLERLRKHSDEADFALFGSLARLQALTPEQLEELDRTWGADPGLGKQVVEDLDELAGQFGVAPSRRLHLRSMANQLTWRLERERFSSVLKDTMTKVEDLLDLVVRQLGGLPALAGGDPGWREQTRVVIARHQPAEPEASVLMTVEEYEQREGQVEQTAVEEREVAVAKLSKLERKRRIILGLGLGLFVLGAVAQFGWFGILWGVVWVGAAVGTVGVVLLIISIVQSARVRKQRKALGI